MADPGGGGGGGGRAPGARAPPFRSSNYIFIVAQYNVLNCNLKLQQQKKRPRFAREQWRIHGGGEGGGGGGVMYRRMNSKKVNSLLTKQL